MSCMIVPNYCVGAWPGFRGGGWSWPSLPVNHNCENK